MAVFPGKSSKQIIIGDSAGNLSKLTIETSNNIFNAKIQGSSTVIGTSSYNSDHRSISPNPNKSSNNNNNNINSTLTTLHKFDTAKFGSIKQIEMLENYFF